MSFPDSIQDVLDRLEICFKNSGFSESTKTNYRRYIQRFLDETGTDDPSSLTLYDAQDYLASLDEAVSPAVSTYNVYVCALRYLYDAVLLTPVTSAQLPKRRQKREAKPIFTLDQVYLLLDSCEDLRLKAAISLGAACGLRTCEIARLRFQDFNKSERIICIWNSKWNRSRFVSFPESCGQLLRSYCQDKGIFHPDPSGFVFPSLKNPQTRLKSSSLSQGFLDYVRGFDFYLPGLSFHTLRHVYATYLAQAGVPLPRIQEQMGHSSAATTALYIHLPDDDQSPIPDLLADREKKKGEDE